MASDDDVMGVSAYLFEKVLAEVSQIKGITDEQLKSKIIARLLWHYSLLNLFIVDQELGGDYEEWLMERRL